MLVRLFDVNINVIWFNYQGLAELGTPQQVSCHCYTNYQLSNIIKSWQRTAFKVLWKCSLHIFFSVKCTAWSSHSTQKEPRRQTYCNRINDSTNCQKLEKQLFLPSNLPIVQVLDHLYEILEKKKLTFCFSLMLQMPSIHSGIATNVRNCPPSW